MTSLIGYVRTKKRNQWSNAEQPTRQDFLRRIVSRSDRNDSGATWYTYSYTVPLNSKIIIFCGWPNCWCRLWYQSPSHSRRRECNPRCSRNTSSEIIMEFQNPARTVQPWRHWLRAHGHHGNQAHCKAIWFRWDRANDGVVLNKRYIAENVRDQLPPKGPCFHLVALHRSAPVSSFYAMFVIISRIARPGLHVFPHVSLHLNTQQLCNKVSQRYPRKFSSWAHHKEDYIKGKSKRLNLSKNRVKPGNTGFRP